VPTSEGVGMIGSLEGSFAHFSGYSVVEVSGTVIDNMGAPVAGAQVTLAMNGETQTVSTNGSGQFLVDFTIYAYGSYTVTVTNLVAPGLTYDAAGNAATAVTVVVN